MVANEPGVGVAVAVVAWLAWVLYEEPLAEIERDRLMAPPAPGMGTGVVAVAGVCVPVAVPFALLGVEDRIKLWVPSDVPPPPPLWWWAWASSILCRMACWTVE